MNFETMQKENNNRIKEHAEKLRSLATEIETNVRSVQGGPVSTCHQDTEV